MDIIINKVGFKQSTVYELVFYSNSVIYVFYTNDLVLSGPYLKEIDVEIRDIKKAKLSITIEGDLQYFLGVNIDDRKYGNINILQLFLIYKVLSKFKPPDNVKEKSAPMISSTLLLQHSDSPDFDNPFH